MQTFQVEVHSRYPKGVAFTPDGRYLAVGAKPFTLLDTSGGPARTFPELNPLPWGFVLVGAGTAIAFCNYGPGAWIEVADLDGGPVRTHQLTAGYGQAVAADPNADAFFASVHNYGAESNLRLFGTADLAERATFAATNETMDRLVLSANGKWLAGKSWGLLWTWNVGGAELPTHAAATVPFTSAALALSGDGTKLVAVNGRGVAMWKTANGEEVFRSGKHRRDVTAVACHPTRPLFVTGDSASTVFLWDHTGRVLTRFDWGLEYVSGLAFAADGLRCAAIGGTGKVVIWDVDV
jgi:hypothetical protein